MGAAAATLELLEPACCSGRDKGGVHIDPVLLAVVDLGLHIDSEQGAAVGDPGTLQEQFLFPTVLQPTDASAWALWQEEYWLRVSQRQKSGERVAKVHNESGAQVPTPTVQEFQSASLLDGLEPAKPTTNTSWHDAPYNLSDMSMEARATRSSNLTAQPRLGVRSVTLDFGVSARAVAQAAQASSEEEDERPGLNECSVPDPPLAWTVADSPRGFEQHESVKAKAQLWRSKTTAFGRQASPGSGDARGDADWTGMAKRMQKQWTGEAGEKRRRVFESAKLEDKLANFMRQQQIKEKSGVGGVSPPQRSAQPKKIAIVDKALEIRLAQQRAKAEGKAAR